jgi:hypothetical protein
MLLTVEAVESALTVNDPVDFVIVNLVVMLEYVTAKFAGISAINIVINVLTL